MTQKELARGDTKLDSLKSLDIPKKKEPSPEPNHPTNLPTTRTKSKAIMNQASYVRMIYVNLTCRKWINQVQFCEII